MGFPRAGLLTFVAIVAIESTWPRSPNCWRSIADALPAGARDVDGGAALAELDLARLAIAPHTAPRVVFVGSSRAHEGFALGERDARRHLAWDVAEVTHPGIRPLQIASTAEAIADVDPDVVVVMLSAFDTHRAVELTPRAHGGHFAAVTELIAALDPLVAWEQRVVLERLALASLLPSYRHRHVLGAAFTDPLRDGGSRRVQPAPPPAVAGGGGRGLSPRQRDEVFAAIDAAMPRVDVDAPALLAVLASHQAITIGPHSDVQCSLVRFAVSRWRARGADVLLVEGPLAPLPHPLHDPIADAQWLAFANELTADPGVHLLPLDQTGPFALDDFRDPTHLNQAGAARLTAAVRTRIDELLSAR